LHPIGNAWTIQSQETGHLYCCRDRGLVDTTSGLACAVESCGIPITRTTSLLLADDTDGSVCYAR